MSDFPLYISIKTNLPKKDLTQAEKNDFIKKVNELEQDAHELIYALIKSYYLDTEKDSLSIPYKGQINKDKIDFNLLDFPPQLRQLLYKFVKMHKKKLKEDKEIKSIHETTVE
jgi:hypothetical protein